MGLIKLSKLIKIRYKYLALCILPLSLITFSYTNCSRNKFVSIRDSVTDTSYLGANNSTSGLTDPTGTNINSSNSSGTVINSICTQGEKKICADQNGKGVSSCNEGAFGTCELLSCSSGFNLNDGHCLPNNCSPGEAQPCADQNHGIGSQTCNSNGSGFSACVISSCDRSSIFVDGSCKPKSCTEGTSRPCIDSVKNGSGIESCNLDSSTWSSCKISTCNQGYYLEFLAGDETFCKPNSCTPGQSVICQDDNGNVGTKTCNTQGSGYNSCVFQSCSISGYQLNSSGICVGICTPGSSQSCNGLNGSGIQYCNNSGTGFNSCQLATCTGGYSLQGGDCVATTPTVSSNGVSGTEPALSNTSTNILSVNPGENFSYTWSSVDADSISAVLLVTKDNQNHTCGAPLGESIPVPSISGLSGNVQLPMAVDRGGCNYNLILTSFNSHVQPSLSSVAIITIEVPDPLSAWHQDFSSVTCERGGGTRHDSGVSTTTMNECELIAEKSGDQIANRRLTDGRCVSWSTASQSATTMNCDNNWEVWSKATDNSISSSTTTNSSGSGVNTTTNSTITNTSVNTSSTTSTSSSSNTTPSTSTSTSSTASWHQEYSSITCERGSGTRHDSGVKTTSMDQCKSIAESAGDQMANRRLSDGHCVSWSTVSLSATTMNCDNSWDVWSKVSNTSTTTSNATNNTSTSTTSNTSPSTSTSTSSTTSWHQEYSSITCERGAGTRHDSGVKTTSMDQCKSIAESAGDQMANRRLSDGHCVSWSTVSLSATTMNCDNSWDVWSKY